MKLKADSATGYRFSAIATLSAAIAGITSLAGLLRLRVLHLRATPLIEPAQFPVGEWPNRWLSGAQTTRELQAAAISEWLAAIMMLLAVIVIVAGLSSLIALFAHGTARRYEVALSAVVGASRKVLRRQQLRDAAMNASIGLGTGTTIGMVTAAIANRTWPDMSQGIAPLAWVMGSAVFAAIVAGLAANATARRMKRAGWLGDALAPEARSNPGAGAEDLRRALLHAQFAFTFALVAAALLVTQHGNRNAHMQQPEAWVTRVELDEHATPLQRRAVQQQLREALKKEAGGAFAFATAGALIGVGPNDQVVSRCGRCVIANMYAPLFPLRAQYHVVSDSFFRVAGVPVLAGREFEERDGAHKYVVVNDTFAGLAFQGQDALGKQIQIGGLRGEWYTVIGVVEDMPIHGLMSFKPDDRGPVRSNKLGREPVVYFNTTDRMPAVLDVVTKRPVNLQLAGATLPSRLRSDIVAAARAPGEWFGMLLVLLSIFAAAIALFSLASITMLNVQQNAQDIAVGRAVGERLRDILRMVVRDVLATAGRGMLVGIVLSVAVARALQMVLPQMRVFHASVVVVAAALLAAVALVAAVLPARAAVSVPPVRVHV